jgi:kumamolisin
VRKDEQVTVTLRLRRKSPLPSPIEGGEFRTLDYDAFRERHRRRSSGCREGAKAFAHEHGLDVPRVSLAQRAVDLAGTVAAMEAAFGTKLKRYTKAKQSFRIRSGSITIPGELVDIVEGVFGLDDRPRVRAYFHFAAGGGKFHSWPTSKAFTPLQVAALYDFPKSTDGKGERIAILEFGGGYRVTDLNKYFSKLGVRMPDIVAVSVSGGHNAPTGNPNSAHGELLLDIEVTGAVAPGAKLAVYFAPNTDDRFLNALYAAVNDNLRRPSIVSISWGSREKDSTLQSLKDRDAAWVDAAALGITICAAAGDHGSSDMDRPGKRASVDFPASSPHVLACGGTHLEANNGTIASETVWNSHDGWATGDGVSEIFPLPDYQEEGGCAEVRESWRKDRSWRARRRRQRRQRDGLQGARQRRVERRRWHQARSRRYGRG